MSLESLGGIVKYGKSSLHRFETAEAMIPQDLPPMLDAAFGTSGIFEILYSLARHEVHPDKYRRHMELEARARAIDTYAGHLVPGLVQTEDYARALFRVANPRATPEQIEEKVMARMSRQTLLRAECRPDLSIILDEAVIRRPVGGPAVMRAQLAALLPVTHSQTSILQLLPFTQGEHALLGGSLELLTLDDGTSVAYEEGSSFGQLLEDAERVGARRRAYDVMRAYALSPSQTAAVIHEAMEALPDEQHP